MSICQSLRRAHTTSNVASYLYRPWLVWSLVSKVKQRGAGHAVESPHRKAEVIQQSVEVVWNHHQGSDNSLEKVTIMLAFNYRL